MEWIAEIASVDFMQAVLAPLLRSLSAALGHISLRVRELAEWIYVRCVCAADICG